MKREDLFENLGVPENWGNPKPLVFLFGVPFRKRETFIVDSYILFDCHPAAF